MVTGPAETSVKSRNPLYRDPLNRIKFNIVLMALSPGPAKTSGSFHFKTDDLKKILCTTIFDFYDALFVGCAYP